MNVVVDRAIDLMRGSFQQEMFTKPTLRAHVFEHEWNGLPAMVQVSLRLFKVSGKIAFVPLGDVSYEDVAPLKDQYCGFSVSGLLLLRYCQQCDYPLYSRDASLLRIAGDMGIAKYELAGGRLRKKMFNYDYTITIKK